MCGIVGVASTEGNKNRSARLQFMKMGLDIDSWRGWESTGLALVPEGSKDAPIVYKRALNGRDFIQIHQVEKYLNDIEKYSVALGHNRAATTGRGNIVDHNAHPFQYGHITLVHNGHIRNTYDLRGAIAGAQCPVDSSHVAWAMNANGEMETLEQIDGGFVLVWWNSEASTLNIARNTERPLHMAFAAKENTLYWASEITELLHLLKDVNIDEDVGILYPAAGNWYRYNIKDLRNYEKIPFVKSQGRHSQDQRREETGGHGTMGGSADWGDEEWDAWEEKLRTSTDQTTKSTMSDVEEIEEVRQRLSNQRLKDAKLSGVPTSKKRLTRARAELKKFGIEWNSLRHCTPLGWVKYKNQDNLGSVVARMRQSGHLVEVLQVRNEEFLKYQAAGVLLVDCVNVRNGPNNDIRIVGVVSSKMQRYLEMKSRVKNTSSIERDVEGPDGQKITMARFLELTQPGCGNCSSDIGTEQANKIVWVGTDASPICMDCSGNPGVMELIGFPDHHKANVH